jgi:hypothetical protein
MYGGIPIRKKVEIESKFRATIVSESVVENNSTNNIRDADKTHPHRRQLTLTKHLIRNIIDTYL